MEVVIGLVLVLFAIAAAIAAVVWVWVNVLVPLWIYVVFPIIKVVAAATAAGLLVLILSGAAIALYKMAGFAHAAFIEVQATRAKSGAKKHAQEPAFLNPLAYVAWVDTYLFVKLYLRNFARGLGAQVQNVKDGNFFRIVIHSVTFLCVLLVGPVLTLLFSIIAALSLGVALLVFTAFFMLLLAVDRIYVAVKGFFFLCPHCDEKVALAAYQCPSCKAVHRALQPNRMGALYHTCTCGKVLPSNVITYRNDVQAICPRKACGLPLNADLIEAKKMRVALVGGPSAGKTVFVIAMLRWIFEDFAQQNGIVAKFEDKTQKAFFGSDISNAREGHKPPKTVVQRHRAITVLIGKEGVKSPHCLYLYDIPGEALSQERLRETHAYLAKADEILFLLDPFSLPRPLQTLHDQGRSERFIEPSQHDPKDVLSGVVESLSRSGIKRKSGKLNKEIHVLLTKTDGLLPMGLWRIGKAAPDIRGWIIDNGGQSFVHALEANFKTVRYSSIAAQKRALGVSTGDRGGFADIASALLGRIAPSLQSPPK